MSKKLEAYLSRGYRSVEGWLLPGAARCAAALAAAQRKAGISGNVAEIGVHHGKLFILLYLLSAAPECALAIDLFEHQDLNIDRSGKGDLQRLIDNLRRHADTERLITHEGDSTRLSGAAIVEMAGGKFRLFSIDGGHTPEVTAHDLATAEAALTEGGIIILDDAFNEMWPGVSEGVYKHFSQARSVVPFAVGANKTFFSHPAYAARYADALRPLATKYDNQKFLGSPVVCLNFGPLTWAEWIGQFDAWKATKDTPLVSLLRHIYRRRT